MKVRHPNFDFSDLDPHWCDNPEQAQMINAGNIIPAYIEPFLIRVLRKARQELDSVADAELIADMEIFNKQEAQHLKMHASVLNMLRANGYEDMRPIEEAYIADFERFLNKKSLRWLLAYCEGFEAFGSNTAEKWVDGAVASDIPGADPLVVELFRWHLAEEYEHRTVCSRLYKRLGHDGGPVIAYFRRLYGLFYAAIHMAKYSNRLQKFLIEKDREKMTAEERAASEARLKVAKKAAKAMPSLRNFVRILSPRYDPQSTPAPKFLDAALQAYS